MMDGLVYRLLDRLPIQGRDASALFEPFLKAELCHSRPLHSQTLLAFVFASSSLRIANPCLERGTLSIPICL